MKNLLIAIDKAHAADAGEQAALEVYREASKSAEDDINRRIAAHDLFTPYELTFAAHGRCQCGAGLAYPRDIGMWGSWYCSAQLLGAVEPNSPHDGPYPFSFYDIKSEGQPSAYGATTRPSGTHVEIAPHYVCMTCGNDGELPRYVAGKEPRDYKKNIVCSTCGTRYLNNDGSSNLQIKTRWFNEVVADMASVPR